MRVRLLAMALFATCCGLAGSPDVTVAQLATDLKCDGCVGKKDIGNDAVRAEHLKKGAVEPSKLDGKAKPGRVAFFETPNATVLVLDTDIRIKTIKVQAPGPGAVVAFTSLYVRYFDAPADAVRCWVQKGNAPPQGNYVVASSVSTEPYDAISQTRTFLVNKKGKVKIKLFC